VIRNSPAAISGDEGFCDTAGTVARLNQESNEARLRTLSSIDRFRQSAVRMELERHRGMRNEMSAAGDREAWARDSGLKARRNNSGHAFNIINFQYHETAEGGRLKLKDKLVKYRSDLRSTLLSAKNHLGFNPITGKQTIELKLPEPPSDVR
jgi:hypothetical protein